MTILIAMLSTGKGSWAQVNELMQSEQWEQVILMTNAFGKEKFTGNADLLVFDLDMPINELSEQMYKALQGYKLGLEVALNLTSGTGKEHMALFSAILKKGCAVRLVYAQQGVMKEL